MFPYHAILALPRRALLRCSVLSFGCCSVGRSSKVTSNSRAGDRTPEHRQSLLGTRQCFENDEGGEKKRTCS